MENVKLEIRNRRFIDLYKEKLRNIGYLEIKSADEILIKSSQRRVPLYYLLFASKHKRGNEFWEKISAIEPTGQRKFRF